MICTHDKEYGLLWCDSCAEQKSGIKPDPEFAYGNFVLIESTYQEEEVGKVRKVEVSIHGKATETPHWSEIVSVLTTSGTWQGSACHLTKLVPEIKFPIPEANEDDDYDDDFCQAGGPAMTPDEVWELMSSRMTRQSFEKTINTAIQLNYEECVRICMSVSSRVPKAPISEQAMNAFSWAARKCAEDIYKKQMEHLSHSEIVGPRPDGSCNHGTQNCILKHDGKSDCYVPSRHG